MCLQGWQAGVNMKFWWISNTEWKYEKGGSVAGWAGGIEKYCLSSQELRRQKLSLSEGCEGLLQANGRLRKMWTHYSKHSLPKTWRNQRYLLPFLALFYTSAIKTSTIFLLSKIKGSYPSPSGRDEQLCNLHSDVAVWWQPECCAVDLAVYLGVEQPAVRAAAKKVVSRPQGMEVSE